MTTTHQLSCSGPVALNGLTPCFARSDPACLQRHPFTEKRFSEFKSDFEVVPVYLQKVARIIHQTRRLNDPVIELLEQEDPASLLTDDGARLVWQ